jgi:molybdopterin adenylyltransferase
MADIPIGVVTTSDRAFRGVYEDKGGPGIEAALRELLATPWRPERRIVPDERPAIEAALITLADGMRCSLILTTGGTGRQVAGTRGSSLIINLPGKPAAIRTCLDAVFAAVPYCIDLIGGARLETDPRFCAAFRPKG